MRSAEICLNKEKKAEGSTIWVTDYCQEYGLFLVKELRETKGLSLRPIGTLIICIDLDTLIEQTSLFATPYDSPSFLLLEDEDPIYFSSNISEKDLKDLPSEPNDHFAVTTVNGQSFFHSQRSYT